MSYVPSNLQVFTAAYSGAIAGMVLGARSIKDTNAADYANQATIAGAFAQALDTAWGPSRATTLLDTNGINAACQSYWQTTQPDQSAASHYTATRWAATALAILAPITAAESYFATQGIVPPVVPGGTPTGGGNIVANLAALAAVATGALQSGTQYYVQTLQTFFTLNATDTLTPDAITIIAASAGGNWLRNITFISEDWLVVPAWYIDPTNGNDENNGQAQTTTGSFIGPLKSRAELSRRWGLGNILNPTIDIATGKKICRVFMLGNDTTIPSFNINLIDTNTYLIWTGVLAKTTLYTGTIGAAAVAVPSTNSAPTVTDASIVSWTTYLGQRCRITSGPRTNVMWWVAKDLGSNQARVSTMGLPGAQVGNPAVTSPVSFVETVAVAGDNYVIESFPTFNVGNMIVNQVNNANLQFLDLALRTGTIDGTFTTSHFVTSGCNLVPVSAFFKQTGNYQACAVGAFNCAVNNAIQGQYLQATLTSGVTITCFNPSLWLVNGAIFQNSQIVGTGVKIVSAQFYDLAGITVPCVVVGQSTGRPNNGWMAMSPSSPFADSFPQSLWGQGNAGCGVFVTGGSQFISLGANLFTNVTIAATTAQFILDTGTTSRAWNETTGLYTAAITNTWANINATIAGGGFGGSAHNVQSNAHMISSINAQ